MYSLPPEGSTWVKMVNCMACVYDHNCKKKSQLDISPRATLCTGQGRGLPGGCAHVSQWGYFKRSFGRKKATESKLEED